MKILSVRKGWLYVVVAVGIGALASLSILLFRPTRYQASVQLFVSSQANSSTSTLAGGNAFAQARVQSYTSVVTSPLVMNIVASELSLGYSGDELSLHVTADAPLNKVLINIHVEDSSAPMSARIANATAAHFAQVVASIERPAGSTEPSPITMTVIHPATIPSSADGVSAVRVVFIGLLAGLIAGLAALELTVVWQRRNIVPKQSLHTSEVRQTI